MRHVPITEYGRQKAKARGEYQEYDGQKMLVAYPMDNIDPDTLNETERLGLAYCYLNSFIWDDVLGPRNGRTFIEGLHEIERKIGEYECSHYWHKFELGETDEEFQNWWQTRGADVESGAYRYKDTGTLKERFQRWLARKKVHIAYKARQHAGKRQQCE